MLESEEGEVGINRKYLHLIIDKNKKRLNRRFRIIHPLYLIDFHLSVQGERLIFLRQKPE